MGTGRNLTKRQRLGKWTERKQLGSASGEITFHAILPAQEGLLHLVSGGGSYQVQVSVDGMPVGVQAGVGESENIVGVG